MAEPLSLASSLLALAAFAFQTTKSLYQVIESFKSSKRAIRELRFEVESLTQALASLEKASAENEAQLKALKLPLLRCGKTCKEFEEVILKCTSHSREQRTSFRDWAKLQYMGGDIADLRTTLAGYKATINIALGGATFRQATVTANVLEEYKEMIAEATSDLQDHLQGINDRVKSIEETGHVQHLDFDLSVVREEKESTEQCLAICTQVSSYIEGMQTRLPRDSQNVPMLTVKPASHNGFDPTRPYIATDAMLTDFRHRLSLSSRNLEARLNTLDRQLKDFLEVGTLQSREGKARLDLIREERDSIAQCLSICADASDIAGKARTNSFEDVTSADESHQLVVSTIGDLISAKHITTGARSVQWLGQMSDDSLQQLSRDQRIRHGEQEDSAMQTGRDSFNGRYGAGYQLRHEQIDMARPYNSGH
ncbi:hypothetical protein BDV27DRAFT_75047 [Aspergillus caelatus]|uniref:Azaphilone pigments biosynthesis cluster protein L N-terminal domain-containing protein n=2 Tax=Aspergillus subgen. Circumdati TaxID=2720871 RepID=A0A5N6ZPD2_9EURO|nr:uncharacterized protein BDV27DRAFT_75047 [Aspergillus caelatus]KAE8358040.1 hypothetical protein BDV27DRAFT_75047 [Aspergillus caelatus]KAE8421607.1 hypothetical protein BDV36DRAFT_247780 [Aspergillus pseudocaelatus]